MIGLRSKVSSLIPGGPQGEHGSAMTSILLSSRSANVINSRAGPNTGIDAELGELTQSTRDRPLSISPGTRFRRYITPWATNLSPKISYEHRRTVGRLKLDLNQDTFGEYPSIDDLTHPMSSLPSPSPGREFFQQTEDKKSKNQRIDRDGDDLGWPTGAVELQIPADKPKRADSGNQSKSGLSSPHGGLIRANLGLPNSVKLESKLRFTTLASSVTMRNEPPETEKERSETAQHETKLQRRERKEQEARAAKAEKIRLKNLRDCAVCMESFEKSQLIHPCHHYYCSECLAGAFKSAFSLTSKSQFRCCRRAIPIALGTPHLPAPFVESYTLFELEISTKNALYCSNTDCNSFIPPLLIHGDWGICPTCSDQTCRYCRAPKHVGSICIQDVESEKLLKLAHKKGWRQCPGCGHLISREAGCKRMTCSRCYTQFCYICGMGPACTCHLFTT